MLPVNRCAKCNSDDVTKRRRRVKRILVEEAGGACRLCGYSRCLAALEFHHVATADKQFNLSRRGVTRSIERARAEARKCILLCSNCHVPRLRPALRCSRIQIGLPYNEPAGPDGPGQPDPG